MNTAILPIACLACALAMCHYWRPLLAWTVERYLTALALARQTILTELWWDECFVSAADSIDHYALVGWLWCQYHLTLLYARLETTILSLDWWEDVATDLVERLEYACAEFARMIHYSPTSNSKPVLALAYVNSVGAIAPSHWLGYRPLTESAHIPVVVDHIQAMETLAQLPYAVAVMPVATDDDYTTEEHMMSEGCPNHDQHEENIIEARVEKEITAILATLEDCLSRPVCYVDAADADTMPETVEVVPCYESSSVVTDDSVEEMAVADAEVPAYEHSEHTILAVDTPVIPSAVVEPPVEEWYALDFKVGLKKAAKELGVSTYRKSKSDIVEDMRVAWIERNRPNVAS